MAATGIIALFSLLSACSKGAHNSTTGLIAALSAFRFLIGIGIGGEYPGGSVAASEQSEEDGVAKNAQHRWVALATSAFDLFETLGWFFKLTARCNRHHDRSRFCFRRLRSFSPCLDVWGSCLGLIFSPHSP